MGKRIEIHEFYPTIYPRLIWVAKLRNEKDINNIFAGRDGSEIYLGIEKGNEPKATTLKVWHKETGKYGVLVCIRSCINVEDVAHEAVQWRVVFLMIAVWRWDLTVEKMSISRILLDLLRIVSIK